MSLPVFFFLLFYFRLLIAGPYGGHYVQYYFSYHIGIAQWESLVQIVTHWH
jgi:hypothetical protein